MQMYGDFAGFPIEKLALFGLVSCSDPCWWVNFSEFIIPR